jgi:phage major head subunit gpT-like protein
MAAINTTHFSEALEPGIRLWYGDAYKQYPEEYSKIFDVKKSNKAVEYSHSHTGFGLVPVKPEGQSVTYDDTVQLYKQTLTNVTYGLGFIVTRELAEDDLYNIISKKPKSLARSVRHTIETLGANTLNNAFDGTNFADGADGKELCATDHPLGYGGTEQNEPTNAADLSMTSLEQAMIDIAAFTDDRGMVLAAKGIKLIIPPALEWTAKQLLQSDKDPETANNAINPAKGSMTYTVNHFLTDPDAWFIKTDVPDSLVWYWRRKPEFTKDNDFDSENAKWKTTCPGSIPGGTKEKKMPLTNFPNGITSFGIPVTGGGIPITYGNVYFVDYDNGSDNNKGTSKDKAFKTLDKANTVVTTNNHDVIILSANSAHTLTEMLTVSKNRVHFVGSDARAGFGMGARSRVSLGVTTAATDIAVMKNTGVGNTFTGIKFDSSNTKAESLYAVAEGGE